MKLPAAIADVLSRAPDYSPAFTARVAAIAEQLRGALHLEIAHDADMNYRAGQSLAFHIPVRSALPPHRGQVEVRIYVASKGALFAIYCIDENSLYTSAGALNHPLLESQLPAPLTAQLQSCRQQLLALGYAEVPFEMFAVPAPGCTTELDDLPATVFQCLFSEII